MEIENSKNLITLYHGSISLFDKPTANDDTRASLRAYNAGAYGEQDSDEAMSMLIRRLKNEGILEEIHEYIKEQNINM